MSGNALVIVLLVLTHRRIKDMLFFGPALFGAGCAVWLAGVAIVYGAVLTRGERRKD